MFCDVVYIMNPRGMPDVSISQPTQDAIDAEAEATTKKTNSEMFKAPVTLDIKHVEKEIPMDRNGNQPEPKAVKKKKVMSAAQLAGLAKGRETSMRNRMAKAKKLKEAKAIASNTPSSPIAIPTPAPAPVQYVEPPPMVNPADQYRGGPPPTQQGFQQGYQQPVIDYDKIINGVAALHTQRAAQASNLEREQREQQQEADSQVAAFEQQIREDERRTLMKQFDDREKKAAQAKAKKVTTQIYNRQPDPSQGNPYSYAFAMNSRNKNSRY